MTSTTATVLVQATDPPGDAALADAVAATLGDADVGRYDIALTVGAYDLVATITTDPDTAARAVLAVQALDGIARTLTLPHVDRTPR